MQPLNTTRMTLAPLTSDHASGPYLSWINDANVTRYMESRFHRHTREDLQNFIERANASEDTLLFGMFLKAKDDRHIGNIKLEIDRHHKRAEIGLMVGDALHWGQGLGSEAIAAITNYAFSDLKLHKVTAGCYADNHASIRAFLKCGFTQECVRPSHYRLADAWVDLVLLGKIEQDGH